MEKIWEYSFSNLHLKTAGAPTHTAVEVNDKEGDQRAAFIDDAVNKVRSFARGFAVVAETGA